MVCGHVDPTSTIKSLTSKYGQKSEAGDIQLYSQGKCNKCNTSWNIELREIEEQDICLIFTQWKDLGPGLDPEDDRWKTHQTRYHRTLKASEMLDDPRLRFEMLSEGCNSPEALSMEGMFRRNMSLLRRQRYRAVMQYSRVLGRILVPSRKGAAHQQAPVYYNLKLQLKTLLIPIKFD